MSAPDRIYLEPDHNQIEGRMWCQDDDPASLGEPWTEYVRADLYTALEAERDRYREALGLILTHATKYNYSTDVIEIAKKALYREEP
jgi:hypothetical protein